MASDGQMAKCERMRKDAKGCERMRKGKITINYPTRLNIFNMTQPVHPSMKDHITIDYHNSSRPDELASCCQKILKLNCKSLDFVNPRPPRLRHGWARPLSGEDGRHWLCAFDLGCRLHDRTHPHAHGVQTKLKTEWNTLGPTGAHSIPRCRMVTDVKAYHSIPISLRENLNQVGHKPELRHHSSRSGTEKHRLDFMEKLTRQCLWMVLCPFTSMA